MNKMLGIGAVTVVSCVKSSIDIGEQAKRKMQEEHIAKAGGKVFDKNAEASS